MAGKSLAAALVAAQDDMPVVHKTATANYGKYATLDAIIEKTKPVLVKHGLAISQFPATTSQGAPGLTTLLLHGESGEHLEATVPLLLNGKNDMQSLGGAITYARRYGWAAVLGIANDEDDDGNNVSSQASEPNVSRSAAGAGAHEHVGDAGAWTWPFGKHKGKTLADTPDDYLDWFMEKSDKQDIKDLIVAFQLGSVASEVVRPDDDIPF